MGERKQKLNLDSVCQICGKSTLTLPLKVSLSNKKRDIERGVEPMRICYQCLREMRELYVGSEGV
jgi:hypothetical protein